MKTIKYKKFLIIQNHISIDHLTQIYYDYEALHTTVSYASLEHIESLEEFICMVWKKDFYEDDKFDYTLQKEQKGLIKAEDLPIENGFLIDINCTCIEYILKTYLRKLDVEKLDINYEAINNCFLLSSNKNDNLYDGNIPFGLSFIFKDEHKIYMIENCIDC